jgi:hypothetical protein
LFSCATLKPIDDANEKGYLLAATNTYERISDNSRTEYKVIYKFGFININSRKINHFKVNGDNPKHGVIEEIPPGTYRLHSGQRRYKDGNHEPVELIPDDFFPRYKPFEFTIEAGQITVLPWYFGIKKVSARYESAESRPLFIIELCQPIAEEHESWIDTWKNNIEYFGDYLESNRVRFNETPISDSCL